MVPGAHGLVGDTKLQTSADGPEQPREGLSVGAANARERRLGRTFQQSRYLSQL